MRNYEKHFKGTPNSRWTAADAVRAAKEDEEWIEEDELAPFLPAATPEDDIPSEKKGYVVILRTTNWASFKKNIYRAVCAIDIPRKTIQAMTNIVGSQYGGGFEAAARVMRALVYTDLDNDIGDEPYVAFTGDYKGDRLVVAKFDIGDQDTWPKGWDGVLSNGEFVEK